MAKSLQIQAERHYFFNHMMALYKAARAADAVLEIFQTRPTNMVIVLNKRHVPLLLDLYTSTSYYQWFRFKFARDEIENLRESILRGEGKFMDIPIRIED